LKVLDEQLLVEVLDIQENLEYKEHPIWILDTDTKETSKTISMCKV